MENYPLIAIAALALALATSACQRAPSTVAGTASPAQLPPPGAKALLAADDPGFRQTCTRMNKRLWIDRIEVLPQTVAAGGEINHRFVYSFCPDGQLTRLRGTLTTTVSYQARTMITDRDPAYTLQPGQWAVDARIVIPPQAAAGRYALETKFVAGGSAFNRAADFSVY